MKPGAASSYDRVLYHTLPREQAHPNRLSMLARLFGLRTAPVERCRVLELGCGTGANLWPMAATLPESQFAGIDAAQRPIEIGSNAVTELGLKNLDLRVMDLREIGPEFGQFDFILAHGVYAWVPEPVRDRLLSVCKRNLAPNGVAFVSYNTYPGGWLRRMVRDMMLYHTRLAEDPLERAGQGRALVEFLSESLPDPDVYRAFLKQELEAIRKHGDWALVHDELNDDFEPVYFHQFAAHAARHGLQYLSDSEFVEMQSGIFAPHVAEALAQLGGDLVAREQYSDFLKCRKFRQTLLVHDGVPLRRETSAEDVFAFYVCAGIRTEREPSLRSDAPEVFTAHEGKASITTNNPLAKAALWRLARVFPRMLSFDELVADVRAILRPGAAHDGSPEDREGERKVRGALAEILLKTFAANLVEFHVWKPPYVTEVSERPEAFPLARWQAREGSQLTTLRHSSVRLEDPLTRALLLLLDGTRNHSRIVDEMALVAGTRLGLAERVEENLHRAARAALLVA
ncbi:MAG: methyltransferase regulatory domain-containing protein [Acidobacteria bacterium]|nr:methyltransferase regulatory domain-containing protein [Acidobacteriota bacterium]